MKIKDFCLKNFRPHFIGVGGVSMSGLAKYLLVKGVKVSGSDRECSSETEKLSRLGVKVTIGHDPTVLKDKTAVIYTSAIAEGDPELLKAKELSIPTFKRSELLGAVLSEFDRSVCVSGSHGKTTSTAMISEILIRAGADPTVFLGGESNLFGNFRSGKTAVAVAEACEYKKNFLDLKPNVAVVLNIDNDHLDCYGDLNKETEAFSEFVKNSLAVINADDVNSNNLNPLSAVTFGVKSPAVYRAERVSLSDNRLRFTLYVYGKRKDRITVNAVGEHNVYNALAAIAVADILKVPFKFVKEGLLNFSGVKRRNEFLGEYRGSKFTADYAHHPTEIAATLKERKKDGKKTLCLFQPHTYSRTSYLFNEFVKVLSDADGVLIYKTYAAREKFDVSGDGKTLYRSLKKVYNRDCFYADDEKTLKKRIDAAVRDYDEIAVIGAGDVYFVVKKIFFPKI